MLDESAVLSSLSNRGGAPHQLPRLLKALDPEDAATLRRILARPLDEVDHANLRRQMTDLDPAYEFSASTWRRWNEEYARNPGKFA